MRCGFGLGLPWPKGLSPKSRLALNGGLSPNGFVAKALLASERRTLPASCLPRHLRIPVRRTRSGWVLASNFRLLAVTRDAQLLAGAPDRLEVGEHIGGHAIRQVDQTMVLENLDATNVLGVEPGFTPWS